MDNGKALISERKSGSLPYADNLNQKYIYTVSSQPLFETIKCPEIRWFFSPEFLVLLSYQPSMSTGSTPSVTSSGASRPHRPRSPVSLYGSGDPFGPARPKAPRPLVKLEPKKPKAKKTTEPLSPTSTSSHYSTPSTTSAASSSSGKKKSPLSISSLRGVIKRRGSMANKPSSPTVEHTEYFRPVPIESWTADVALLPRRSESGSNTTPRRTERRPSSSPNSDSPSPILERLQPQRRISLRREPKLLPPIPQFPVLSNNPGNVPTASVEKEEEADPLKFSLAANRVLRRSRSWDRNDERAFMTTLSDTAGPPLPVKQVSPAHVRQNQTWTGEWNTHNMAEVIVKLRNL
ncbi:hypothetical protein C8J56DRAFT_931164, partial [Mycena floridula]